MGSASACSSAVSFHAARILLALGSGEQRELRHPQAGIRGDLLQQDREARCHALHRRGVEQVGRVLEAAEQTTWRLGDPERQVELGRPTVGGQGPLAQVAGRAAVLFGRVLKHQHRLEQRRSAGIARRMELLHEPLEGQILVRVRGEADLAHARKEAAKGLVVVERRRAAPAC